jgi:hypothetical protein
LAGATRTSAVSAFVQTPGARKISTKKSRKIISKFTRLFDLFDVTRLPGLFEELFGGTVIHRDCANPIDGTDWTLRAKIEVGRAIGVDLQIVVGGDRRERLAVVRPSTIDRRALAERRRTGLGLIRLHTTLGGEVLDLFQDCRRRPR